MGPWPPSTCLVASRPASTGPGSPVDRLHQRFSTAANPLPDFEAGLVEWRDDLAALECGAGTGLFWTNRIAPRSISVTVTDLSPGMVAVAVARAVAELARVLRPGGTLLAATNGYGHMAEMNDAAAEVFGTRTEGLYEVFGIDTGEARLREQFASITWHAFDNDLIIDDPAAAVAYGLSYPPGETATGAQAEAFAEAIARRFVDGRMRIRTRAGAFVCRDQRSRD